MLKLHGYQVFEKIRSNKSGGGLLTAVVDSLSPVLIDDNDSAEILTVQISLAVGNVYIVNCYGPQEYDNVSDKLIFWQSLEEITVKARETGNMLLW